MGICKHGLAFSECKDCYKPESEPLPVRSESAGSVSSRVAELEDAIVNIFKWTGGKRVARECRRVLPDVHERLDARQKPNVHNQREQTKQRTKA